MSPQESMHLVSYACNFLLGLLLVIGGFVWKQMESRVSKIEEKQQTSEVYIAGTLAGITGKIDALFSKVSELLDNQKHPRRP